MTSPSTADTLTPPTAVEAPPASEGGAAADLGTAATTTGPSSAAPADRRQSRNAPADGVEKRQNVVDRRCGLERRVIDLGSPTGLERRRGPGRRRSDDRKSAEEGEMTDEQFEFIMAVDTYKRLNNRPFPTWTEVLEVVKQLGYRKVAASTIRLPNSNGRAEQS
jgi:hypothetical protein